MRDLDNLYSFEDRSKALSEAKRVVESTIKDSGNSNVDISVLVDTTPIAYAMLCSLLATRQLSQKEFETAVRKLEKLTNNNNHYIREKNDLSKVRLMKES